MMEFHRACLELEEMIWPNPFMRFALIVGLWALFMGWLLSP